ncbi:unnamed protein product, partial [Mycena citricolor]
ATFIWISNMPVLIPSDMSVVSLSLSQLSPDEPLLSQSLTLSSISTAMSSNIPTIPAGCIIPFSTIIGHREGPTMGCTRTFKATPTAPTSPRLRTMLKEKLLIETWLNGVDSDSSVHAPWTHATQADSSAWKAEGSAHSPESFKERIELSRREKSSKTTQTFPSLSKRNRNSNRDALVFEREIILNTGKGKSKRVSLQAPATRMDPEVVDMISELKDLNAFFKEQETILETPPALSLPSLIISNSHFSMPVSLESSGNLSSVGTPLALAARRGKKMLPRLTFKKAAGATDYPSMPTAFLGTPSAYSPNFQFSANAAAKSSMDVREMITSLRSQCGPIDSDPEEDEYSICVASVESDEEAANDDDDEWAFADGLVDTSELTESVFLPACSPPETVPSASAPPATPLPPCPGPQRASVRSILKSSKSVRFASLPHERKVSVVNKPSAQKASVARAQSTLVRPKSLNPSPVKTSSLPSRHAGQRRATIPVSFRPDSSAEVPSTAKTTHSAGRHSLSRVFSSANPRKEKENRPFETVNS